MTKDWSIKEIQDLILEREEWTKKNLYATDSDKCPRGIYYALIGEKESSPDDPEGIRRMEVGTMVEYNQIKKLKSLGILIEAQRRIADEEYNVSGRHDGIVISPVQCTDEAKEMIERKKEIFKELATLEKMHYQNISSYQAKEIDRKELMGRQISDLDKKQDLYDEDYALNQELLKPNPENSLILIEIKSTVLTGFKWREKEGPSESHSKQIMFYLWKLREIYPWMKGRIIYVDTSYQNILEFDVDVDPQMIEDLKRFWSHINECVKNKELPPAAPDIVQDSKYKKWKVNYQAEWCKYHNLCTGDPDWLGKAIKKVADLNKK